jgi:hypothetical protein
VTDWRESGSEQMSDKQRRLLNAACGDLAEQLCWHEFRLSKEGWRHFFAGTVLGNQALPAWDFGDGRQGVIFIGRSSLELSKSNATDCIQMAFMLGDDPSTQNIDAPPVDWCDVIKLARGIGPNER